MLRFPFSSSNGCLLRLWAALLLGAQPAVSLSNPQKPKENAEVLVAVRVAGYDVPGSALMYFGLWEAGGPTLINGAWSGSGPGVLTTPGPQYALMKPGRHYQANLSSGDWDYGEAKFSAPPGYSIWIDDRPVSTVRRPQPTEPTLIFKIELRADSASLLPAGLALPPRVGDLIWQISAGRYSNGLSAGAVQWRAPSLSAALLDPTSLSYLEPDSAEVAVTRHSDGALLELRTFQFLLYVRRNETPGTGYDIEIYSPYAFTTDLGDGPYTYNETPYRTYRVSNPAGATWNNQIKIEKIETTTETWTITQSGANWTIVETNSLRTITRTSTGSSPRVETVEVKDNANVVATKLTRTYQSFAWGQEEMTQEVANPDALNGPALTTTYAYHTTSGAGGYGRLKSITYPDGSWVRYEYDDTAAGFGNLAAVYRPWQDAPSSPDSATAANCAATTFSYAGERNVFLDLPAGAETKILGTTAAKNTVSHTFPGNAPNGQPLRNETITTYTASGSTLVSTRQIYNPTTADPDFLGRLYSQTGPDGAKVSALRYKSNFWNYGDNNATNLHGAGNTWGEYRFYGFSTQVQDSVPVNNWDGQSFDTVYMAPGRSTIELVVFDDKGLPRWAVQFVFTGATGGTPVFEFLSMQETGYYHGIPALQTAKNGYRDQLWLINDRLSGHTYNDGSYVEYTRDALGRDTLVRQWYQDASGEYPYQNMVHAHRAFDAAGRVLSEKISDSSLASDPGLLAIRTYNLAGLLKSETSPDGLTTNYAYTNGGRTVTTTLPSGATQVIDRYLDGSVKSVAGTAVVSEYHSAAVNADGTITRTAYIGPGVPLSPRWTRVTTDWLGRTVKEEKPAPPGATPSTFTRTFTFNSIGQLIKTTENNLADTLFAYNPWQQPFRTGLDLDANGALDPASTDRITETDAVFEKDANAAWWVKTTTKAYNQEGNATPVTTSIAKQRFNKFDDHGISFGSYVQSETQAIDIFGNTTKKTVAVQRGGSYFETNIRLVTETVDYPDSSTDEVTVTRNGLLQKRQTAQGLVYRTYYDSLGRVTKTTDPRTDPNPTPARLGFYDNTAAAGSRHQIAWTDDPAGNRTEFFYDGTGRLSSQENPLDKRAYFSYTARGELNRTWGAATYPAEYAFNDYGEQTSMKTFRDGTGWDGPTWPGAGTADLTTWNLEPATGLLLSKTDAANNVVSYTYTVRGQLKTRAWARGVTTTYSYSPTTAEQTAIDYSDSTPDLSYTYTRLGQTKTVIDATSATASDQRIFAYSATTTQLQTETFSSFFNSRVLTREYDTSTTGALGRVTGHQLGSEQNLDYGYDAYGRFNSLSLSPSLSFTYGYTASSNLIAGLTETTGSNFAQTRTYLANRNLLDIVETKVSTASKAKFDYDHDALGRRANVVQSGEIFSRYNGSGLVTHFGYNDRSELISAQTYNGQNPADTTSPLSGRNLGFAYDNIGNRASASVDGSAHSYTSNNLNQVTQTTRYPGMTVTGLAPSSATVTVNGATASRQGEYFHHWVGAGSASTPVWWNLNVSSTFGGAETRNTWTPASPQSYNYDLDGNLVMDDRWGYTWDAENRLIAMETLPVAFNAGTPRQRLEFAHDYLGRRVRKLVRGGWNGSAYTTVVSETRFLYDGWNLIAEYDALTPPTLTLTRRYVWSGSASNPGSLLAITHASGTVHLPAYDGNGNLLALVNKANGAIEAAYEYDAFGRTIRATGAYAKVNPFRFSTKYADDETHLVYYGFRYYDPKNGRFLGRDPIEEKGGLNLYAFVRNGPVNAWDYLGMESAGYNWVGDFLMLEGDTPEVWTFEEVSGVDRSGGYGRIFLGSRPATEYDLNRGLSIAERAWLKDSWASDDSWMDRGTFVDDYERAALEAMQEDWARSVAPNRGDSSGESLLSMIGRGIKNLFGGGGGNSGGSAPNIGGNRYDSATDRWIRPDGSSYRTSTSVSELKVLPDDAPLPRPQYIPSAPSPSFRDQFTPAQWATGVVAAQETAAARNSTVVHFDANTQSKLEAAAALGNALGVVAEEGTKALAYTVGTSWGVGTLISVAPKVLTAAQWAGKYATFRAGLHIGAWGTESAQAGTLVIRSAHHAATAAQARAVYSATYAAETAAAVSKDAVRAGVRPLVH